MYVYVSTCTMRPLSSTRAYYTPPLCTWTRACSVAWLAGWLAGWLVDWLVGRPTVRSVPCLDACPMPPRDPRLSILSDRHRSIALVNAIAPTRLREAAFSINGSPADSTVYIQRGGGGVGRGKKGTEEEADFFHHFPSLLDVGGIFLSFFFFFSPWKTQTRVGARDRKDEIALRVHWIIHGC